MKSICEMLLLIDHVTVYLRLRRTLHTVASPIESTEFITWRMKIEMPPSSKQSVTKNLSSSRLSHWIWRKWWNKCKNFSEQWWLNTQHKQGSQRSRDSLSDVRINSRGGLRQTNPVVSYHSDVWSEGIQRIQSVSLSWELQIQFQKS